jgi:hypothetical protein
LGKKKSNLKESETSCDEEDEERNKTKNDESNKEEGRNEK